MVERDQNQPTYRLAGYAWLVERYDLEVIPNWHKSLVATAGTHHVKSKGDAVEEIYPPVFWPGDTLGGHLEFALKYDGTNLLILACLFSKADAEELLGYIRSKPTGKYARRIWFLYEFLTDKALPLADLKTGNYIDLLEPDKHYTVAPALRVRRQRVRNNLMGDGGFCPTVRRTRALSYFEQTDFPDRCRQVVAGYSPEILKRALGYLYAKETKSSFEIEHIKPTSTRTDRFVALLQMSEREDFCKKDKLIEAQNYIVDPRFRDAGYRSSQNYVGETVAWQGERIHYVPPKPEDLAGLMEGLLLAHEHMETGGVHAVVHAAVMAYGFVFLHPFEDGNGRLHRFLIHNILARRGYTPEGLMFPVSASMLKNPGDYDASLETYSFNLLPLVEYSLDEHGVMTVGNDTSVLYRYIDMTHQAEALFHFIEQTIETELAGELMFLANYDKAKKALQEIVDIPDRQIDLFIRFCLQNNGRLSEQKRASFFAVLTDVEIERMERVVQDSYGESSEGIDGLE